jgi:hypothetical protein
VKRKRMTNTNERKNREKDQEQEQTRGTHAQERESSTMITSEGTNESKKNTKAS